MIFHGFQILGENFYFLKYAFVNPCSDDSSIWIDQDPSLESEDTNLLQIKVVLGPQGMCMPLS